MLLMYDDLSLDGIGCTDTTNLKVGFILTRVSKGLDCIISTRVSKGLHYFNQSF